MSAPPIRLGQLWRLAGPTIASRLGIMAMGLTDAIVVGRYSAEQLGLHALGWAPTSIVLVGGVGLLMGIQVLTARHMGAGRPEETGPVLRRGLAYALLIGLIATAGLAILGPLALANMGLEPAVAAGATAVLLILAASLIPYLLADAIWFWLEALSRPGVPMAAMWAANILNLGLSLWMVPGHSPFPVDGAEAAAWTTLAARTMLLLMLAGFVLSWPRARSLGVFQRPRGDRAAEAEQRRIGYSAGISYAVEAGAFAGMNFVAAQLGVLVVAAWSVVLNIAAVIFMVPLGLGAATAVLVSGAVGARDPAAASRAFGLGLASALAVLALLSALIALVPAPIAAIYTTDARLLAMVAPGLLLAAMFFMADGAQVVAANALRARGDIWWPTGMHLVSYLIVMLPLGWWLGVRKGQGLDGILWSVIVASLLSAGALVARFRHLDHRLKASV